MSINARKSSNHLEFSNIVGARPYGAAATCGELQDIRFIFYSLQIIAKRSISVGEMYSTICAEWAAHHFGLGST